MKKIEQIDGTSIINDFDEKLSNKELKKIICKEIEVYGNNNPYIAKIEEQNIFLFIKQITYLGHPHLAFKKRIQISKGWENYLKSEYSYLIGVYKYKETVIYAIFNKDNYINRNVNNSSAHVSTFDLLNAQKKGFFTKKDIRGNLIICTRRDYFKEILLKIIKKENIYSQEILLFESFKSSLNINYKGVHCYEELITNNYRNKYQPEWFGFFLEYKFEKFLELNPELKSICNYQSNKLKTEIDLDLNFHEEFLGDLKTHSNDSSAILGNDKTNIEKALEKYGKIWYIVFCHNTYHDKNYHYEVTLFWNKQQNKSNLMSYSTKMKNTVELTKMMILEINKYNYDYLTIFNQGINSNKLPRKVKIKIDKKMINNFLIYSSDFN